jgi:hypothetical protein
MIDPKHLTQEQRIALTFDIQERYAPLFEKVLARPIDDPDRNKDFNDVVKQQKKEMDMRFNEVTKKPIVKSVEYDEGGHLIKHRSLTPDTFIFHMGVKPTTCLRCGKLFIKSKTRRKYCSQGCGKLAKTESHTQKRRARNQSTHK